MRVREFAFSSTGSVSLRGFAAVGFAAIAAFRSRINWRTGLRPRLSLVRQQPRPFLERHRCQVLCKRFELFDDQRIIGRAKRRRSFPLPASAARLNSSRAEAKLPCARNSLPRLINQVISSLSTAQPGRWAREWQTAGQKSAQHSSGVMSRSLVGLPDPPRA